MGILGFDGFEILFSIMFVLVFGCIVVTAIRGILQWNKNNNSPRLTVEASVVTKRSDVSCHRHHSGAHGGHLHTTTSTAYYVTFQVESGDRLELQVSGREYGMLVQGDFGKLTFQGTRYLDFHR